MRGSAPQTLEYRTNLNTLPLMGSIRFLLVAGVVIQKSRPASKMSPAGVTEPHFIAFVVILIDRRFLSHNIVSWVEGTRVSGD